MDFYINRGHSPLEEGLTAYRYGSTHIYYIEYMFEKQERKEKIIFKKSKILA